MIWSPALPGAALRVMRRAAGWRALQVALLVGGVFVLGLLFGERAQAAEGVPPAKDVVGTVADVVPAATGGSEAPGERDGAGAKPAGETSASLVPDLRPVTGHVVRSVQDRVVRPVDDLVRMVSEDLESARSKAPPLELLPLEPLPSLPAPPPLPAVPDMPSLPAVPEAPVLPAVPAPPALPDVSDPHPDLPAAPVSPAASQPGHDPAATASSAAAPTSGAPYGPRLADGAAHPTAHGDTHRSAAAHAPARPAPAGDPDGALGNGSAADNGTPRHGDAHAVTLHHQVPLRLVPGAVVRADSDEVQDRYRDIPVSPA
ncbi:hypothetical protein H0H10_28795 [Streptomyces sp. TRM S81-3]|uniref:Uncharacterized protein n=1 Tax=Streptomyces griseicoloratus TaxID=2752516 RepID=A0A926LAN2_9ACTN|nr:hypothetical protein [Streptomyces griseicoloratus]MBD0423108.1 hypothetical protein [Streptomyces griseicoloratus]